MLTVKFRGETCDVQFSHYHDGRRVAILLVCQDGEPMASATVNLPDEPLEAGHVFIKDWSENAGIAAVLQQAGIIADTGRRVPAGHDEAIVAKLLVQT